MSTTLKNTGRRPITVMLDHLAVSKRFTKLAHDRASGKVSAQRVDLSVPGSITVLPGEIVTNLPDSVADCADVKAAAAQGLKVLVTKEEEPAAPAPETDAPAAPADTAKVAKRKGK